MSARPLLLWMLANYWLRGAPISLEGYKYLLGLLSDTHSEIVVIKAAQVGVSESFVARHLYVPAELGLTSIYFLPSKQHIGDFVQHRVMPVIDGSPNIRAMTRQVGAGSGGAAYKTGLFRIGSGFAYQRGMNSRNDVISVPSDLITFDELDDCQPEHVPLARERVANSDYARIMSGGTPTIPGWPLDAAYKASDVRRWMLKCDACGTWQWLDWHRHVVREVEGSALRYVPRDPRVGFDLALALSGDRWKEAARSIETGDIAPICERCSAPMNRFADGQWVEEHPGRAVHGYHIPRILSPRVSLYSMYHQFCGAIYSVVKMEIFYRMALGLPYEISGDGLTPEILKALLEAYGGYDPATIRGAGPVTIGMDVGAVVHAKVSKLVDGRRIGVAHATLKDEDEVVSFIRTHRAAKVVIDAFPETRFAEAIRDALPEDVVFLASFAKEAKAKIQGDEDWITIDELNHYVAVDRTKAFDESHAAMVDQNPRAVFPSSWGDDKEWSDQMCVPRRVRITGSDGRGRDRIVWANNEKPDHYRLAELYDYLAEKILVGGESVSPPASAVMDRREIQRERSVPSGLDGVMIPPGNWDSEDLKIIARLSRKDRPR